MSEKRWNGNSLKTWITAGLSLIVIITVLSLTLITQWLVQRAVTETSAIVIDESESVLATSVTETNESFAQGLGDNLEQTLAAFQQVLFTLSLSPNIRNGETELASSFIEAQFYAESSLLSLSLTDTDGSELFRVTRDQIIDPTELRQLSDDLAYVIAYTDQRYISPMKIDPESHRPFITVSESVERFPGEITGVLIAEIDLTEIWDLVALADLGENSTGYLYVVDTQTDQLVAHPDRQRIFTGDDPISLDLTGRLDGQTVSNRLMVDGEEFLISSVHNTVLDWVVVAVEPTATALASVQKEREILSSDFDALLNNIRYVTIIVSAIILVVAITLAVIGVQRILLPINELVTGTKSVAEGNLSYRLKPRGYQEASDLTIAFNYMTEALQTNNEILEQEISERKQTEGKLDVERTLLLTIVETALDFIYVKDKEGRYLVSNRSHIRSMGKQSVEDVLGKTNAEIHPSDTASRYNADEQLIMETGQAIIGKEEHRLNQEGQSLWMSTTKVPLQNKDGEIIGIVGITRDVTHFKEIEADLITARDKAQETSRLKTEFLNVISHELRTPLTVMLGNTPLLTDLEDLPEAEEIVEIVVDIEEAGQHLLTLVNDLLDLSKIEADKMELHYDQLLVHELVKVVVSSLQTLVDEKNVILELQVEEIVIVADPIRLKQILLNLLGNAVKFTQQGRIIIIAEQHNEEVRFQVRDTGQGMREEVLPFIFDAFRQADSSSTRLKSGTGLGLAITKRLVELHKGQISVESTLGKGSVFTFSIPLMPPIEKEEDLA